MIDLYHFMFTLEVGKEDFWRDYRDMWDPEWLGDSEFMWQIGNTTYSTGPCPDGKLDLWIIEHEWDIDEWFYHNDPDNEDRIIWVEMVGQPRD